MKKCFTLIIAVVMFGMTYGQISISHTDYPEAGIFYPIGYDDDTLTLPSYDYFLIDTSFSWAPPSVTNNQPHYYIFKDPADSILYSTLFPTANLINYSPGQGYSFLEKTDDYVILLGVIDSVSLNEPVVLHYDTPDTLMVFPFNYMTEYTSTYDIDYAFSYVDTVSFPGFDSLHIITNVQSASIVNGWGTLVHPGGTFNVLHETKTKLHEEDVLVRFVSFGGLWQPIVDTSYTSYEINFYTEDIAIPLYTVRTEEDSTITEVQWLDIVYTEMGVTPETPLFFVYPNPSSDLITLKTMQGSAERVQIYDITGRLKYNSILSSNQLQIDISSWDSGIYIIRWIDDNNLVGEYKIVKE